jgi:hypothetical protein
MVNPAELRSNNMPIERERAQNAAEVYLGQEKERFRATVAEYVEASRAESYCDTDLYLWGETLYAGREVGAGPGSGPLIVLFQEDGFMVTQGVGQASIRDTQDERGNTIHVLVDPSVDDSITDKRTAEERAADDAERAPKVAPAYARDAISDRGWEEFDLDAVDVSGAMVLGINSDLIRRWTNTLKMSRY